MAGKQDKISNNCPESCSLYSHGIAKVLLYVFVWAVLLKYCYTFSYGQSIKTLKVPDETQ